MKVKNGNVTKNIPAKYHVGFKLMLEADFDKPHMIRLTPWERFRIALFTWESKQAPVTLRYLAGSSPECVIRQYNRQHQPRYVVRYVEEADGDLAKHVIVSNTLGLLCPVIVDDYVDWI